MSSAAQRPKLQKTNLYFAILQAAYMFARVAIFLLTILCSFVTIKVEAAELGASFSECPWFHRTTGCLSFLRNFLYFMNLNVSFLHLPARCVPRGKFFTKNG